MKKLRLLFLSLFLIGLIGTTTLFGQTAGDFRSAQSGAWRTTTTWETYNGTSWVAASQYPDSNNILSANVVTILNTHNVTLLSDSVGVRNVIVNQGATLTLDGGTLAGAKIYITQGSMTVNGTLTLTGVGNATAPYSVNRVVNPIPATITIGSTGVVNFNQTQSAAVKGGLPTATWLSGSTLNVNSTGGPAATGWGAGSGQDFYNLNWDVATQGTFGWGFNNTIGGTVKILRTGTAGRVQLFGGSDGTLNIMGDLIVSGAASLTSNGTSSVTHDTINVYGNVNVNTTGNFSVSRGSQGSTDDPLTSVITGTAIWNFYGEYVNIIAGSMNNSFKSGGGGGTNQKFVFKRIGTQYLSVTIPSTSTTGNVFPMEVVAGTTVSLASTVNVTTLYLSGGMIVSSASNPLVMGFVNSSGAVSGGILSPLAPGSSTSFVSGPMAYLYATLGGTTTKVYPIGKGGNYRPLSLSFTQTAATLSTYTAEMFNTGIVSNTLPGTLNSVSSARYYSISESAGGSAFTAGEVKLSYDTDDGVTDAAILRIAQGPSAGGGTWVNLGGTGSGSPAGTINSSIAFTSLTNTVFALAKAATKTLTLTAFLEGVTNGGGTAMRNDFWPITVTVELHDASTLALVEAKTGVLSTAGVGTFTFTTAADATPYYIVVKSDNTVETWSAAAQSFTSGALSYNFSTAAEQAYGSNMTQKGSTWCIYSGDVAKDATNIIDLSDVIAVDNDNTYGVTTSAVTDITGDGIVDISDVINVDNNNTYGISRQAPGGAPMAKRVIRPGITQKQNIK